MAIAQDRTKFLLSDPTRLAIAGWCAAEPLSRGMIAARLHRPSGSISAPDTMLKHKALMRAGHDASTHPGRRAELLKLNPAWRKSLEEARRLQPPGKFERETDLLLIPLVGTESACQVLARGDIDIEWGARLDGEQVGLVLSPRHDPHSRATIRAVAALDRAGVRAARVRLQSVMAAEELQKWASVVAGEDRRDLPPPAE
jgi:transposase